MGTINPRARGDASLRDELKASRADRQQIRRQRTATPKPKPAAAGGSMQGFTRAWPDRPSWDGVNANGWTFDTGADESPGEKPSLTADGPYFGPTEPGWYSTHVVIQFTLGSGSPAGVLIQANNNSSNVSTNGEVWAMNLYDGRYRAAFWCGPFWCDGSSLPLGVSAQVPGEWSPGDLSAASFVDVWRVG